MSRERTILNDLDSLPEKLAEMYKIISADTYVKQAKYYFGYDDLPAFFALFNQGIDYALKIYGEDCLASGLQFYSWFVDEHQQILVDYIGYNPNGDLVQMSFLHIARACANLSNSDFVIVTDKHLPGVHLGVETHVVLQAIEECYHRYQIHHLGYPVLTTSEMMRYEQEITSIWQKALRDLNLHYLEGFD